MRRIMHKSICIYILFTLFVTSVHCCINANISITQKVENEGFHRTIDWLIEFSTLNNFTLANIKSRFALYLNILPGMYVNPDEVAELNRRDKLHTYIRGYVSVETPMHQSDEHQIYVYLPESNSNKISIRLPMHLRYQKARIAGEYGNVILEKPSLLFYATKDGVKLCGRWPRVQGPCLGAENKNCTWRNISYDALFEENALFVPIGNLDDYPLVSLVTLMLGCAGCVYILSLLTTTPL